MGVEVHDESGRDVDVERLGALAHFLLGRLRIHPLAELSVLAVDKATMADHHVKWMDEDGPTDVMAFPMDELRPADEDEEPQPGLLGDVLLCPEVAERQAAEAGHTREHELDLLCTHGVLHLLGYDHGEPEEKTQMFGLQARLLAAWWSERGVEPGVLPA